MKNKTIHIFTALLLLLVALAAAGCGSGARHNPGAAGPAADKPLPGQTQVLVATDPADVPFEFKSGGKYTGFDIDLMRAVAEVNNWHVEFREMKYNEIMPALDGSTVDMAISAIPVAGRSGQKVDFSLPYFGTGLSILTPAKNSAVKGWDDLKNKRLGVQIATAGAELAYTIPGAKVTAYDDANEALKALKQGDVDAVVNDYPVNAYLLAQGVSGVKMTGGLRAEKLYGIAVSRGKPGMLDRVDSALKTLKNDGRFAAIYKKWFGQAPPAFLPGEPAARRAGPRI
ncbi:transporter substrate-binding domain-containing protein [Desulfotomaculum copahuensis]|uniref:transporter substrate-binding domain-containing protein n=1 Tax=Desulfotomaculum copahuensis TaxID=1838280 RepID=UPI000A635087|nr:transporter substrate-binding domain-containing protein [Desulfotomaculum copahuensis]